MSIDFLAFPRTVGIVGSRSFDKHSRGKRVVSQNVEKFVSLLLPDTHVISGGAEGVDTYASDAAQARGLRTTVHRPDRTHPVPQRYFIRNRQIVNDIENEKGALVAFIDQLRYNGTRNTITEALRRDIPVYVYVFTENGVHIATHEQYQGGPILEGGLFSTTFTH